eukprot:COSAG06_NODE_1042_length_10980_cov_31.644150_2_plen_46_part_00
MWLKQQQQQLLLHKRSSTQQQQQPPLPRSHACVQVGLSSGLGEAT